VSVVHVAVQVPAEHVVPATQALVVVHVCPRGVVPEVVPVPSTQTPKFTAPEVVWRLAHVWPDPQELALMLQIGKQTSVVELVSTQMSPPSHAAVEQSPFTPTVPVPAQNANSSPVSSAPMLQASPAGHPEDGRGVHGVVQTLPVPVLTQAEGLLAVPN